MFLINDYFIKILNEMNIISLNLVRLIVKGWFWEILVYEGCVIEGILLMFFNV